jgi:hypothetical protein
MLSELRKYGLGIMATTQYGSRLSDTVREAVFGNVGTIIAFRVGATDAQVLEKQFGGDLPRVRDLVNLPNYEMYLKLMVDGVQTKPFSARGLPPPVTHSDHTATPQLTVIKESRKSLEGVGVSI